MSSSASRSGSPPQQTVDFSGVAGRDVLITRPLKPLYVDARNLEPRPIICTVQEMEGVARGVNFRFYGINKKDRAYDTGIQIHFYVGTWGDGTEHGYIYFNYGSRSLCVDVPVAEIDRNLKNEDKLKVLKTALTALVIFTLKELPTMNPDYFDISTSRLKDYAREVYNRGDLQKALGYVFEAVMLEGQGEHRSGEDIPKRG
jgi:hypothetical protein